MPWARLVAICLALARHPLRPRVRSTTLESRLRSGHARSVENAHALSTRRDMFLDERGAGLRVTWHPERDLVVLSVWQDDSCVGTFRMPVQDVPRLSGLLAAALGDWVDQAGTDPQTSGPGAGGDPGTSWVPGMAGGPGVAGGPGTGAAGARRGGLSVPQRIRLSRAMLRFRGRQQRRRRSS
jgi:hypothetical protein